MNSNAQLTFADIKPFNGLFEDLKPEIVKDFFEFHEKNPTVFQLFRRFALAAKQSGRNHYGAKAIMEKVRWEMEIERRGEFKINNSHTSCFSRLLIFLDPSFADFFAMRHTPGNIEIH